MSQLSVAFFLSQRLEQLPLLMMLVRLKKLKKSLYVLKACHVLEYSCTLYVDIFEVEMEVFLKKRIVLRGWHVYGETV